VSVQRRHRSATIPLLRNTARRDPFLLAASSIGHERYFEPDCCANCVEPLPDEVAGLFCSPLCKQTAEFVRYWRRVTRDGRYEQPDVREAVYARVAHLLGGGYDAAARYLNHDARKQVKTRDGGLCRRCGKPGEEIDHIDGDSPAPGNLQLLCKVCHHGKTAERMHPASPEQQMRVAVLYATRVKPGVPVLLADDGGCWQHEWLGLRKERSTRLEHGITFLDHDLDDEDDDDEARGLDDDSGFGPDSYFAHAMAKDD